MYYELVILGTLMGGPFHGYLIAKIVQNILGPYSKMSAGRLYPLLARLEGAGLIGAATEVPPGARWQGQRPGVPSRSYRITAAGRERFREVMLDTTAYLGDYQRAFLQKVTYFSFLPPAECLLLVEHYRDHCQSLVRYGETRAEAFGGAGAGAPGVSEMSRDQRADILTAMRHTTHRWREECAWADQLREQIAARRDAAAPPEGTA